MALTLKDLEQKHFEILSNNNWEDTEEARKLETEYRDLNNIQKEYCIECNRLSTIHCQYH